MPEDPFIHHTVFAYCEKCRKLVSVAPLFTKPQAFQAFQTGAALEVMHTAASGGEHRWKLDNKDRENLRKSLSKGEY